VSLSIPKHASFVYVLLNKNNMNRPLRRKQLWSALASLTSALAWQEVPSEVTRDLGEQRNPHILQAAAVAARPALKFQPQSLRLSDT
jgi:hypothetical protein